MGRRVMVGVFSVMLVASGAVSSFAQDTKTIQGEVVDPALYLREGRHGVDEADLINEAIDGGQSLALLEDGTNIVYLFLAGEPGEDPNDLVYEYVGQRVKVTGTPYERNGLNGIVAATVEPTEATATSTPPPTKSP